MSCAQSSASQIELKCPNKGTFEYIVIDTEAKSMLIESGIKECIITTRVMDGYEGERQVFLERCPTLQHSWKSIIVTETLVIDDSKLIYRRNEQKNLIKGVLDRNTGRLSTYYCDRNETACELQGNIDCVPGSKINE